MYIKCNKCKESKQISSENYEQMLKRFAWLRGFEIGLIKSIPSMFDKRFLLPDTEPLKHINISKLTKEQKQRLTQLKKETSLTKILSKPETEEDFLKLYKCRNCKNQLKNNFNIIEDLKRNFKPWKQTKEYKKELSKTKSN